MAKSSSNPSSDRSGFRVSNLVIAIGALLTLALVYIAVSSSPHASVSAADRAQPAPAFVTPTPTYRSLPTSGNLVVIGDSWTYGIAAQPITQGYAYDVAGDLGLTPQVFGYGSVGYVNKGGDGSGNFLERFEAAGPPPDAAMVLVQGTQNDLEYQPDVVENAAEEMLAKLKQRYPDALIVLLGPAASTPGLVSPMSDEDQALRPAASKEGIPYISPIGEDWFGADKWGDPSWVTTDSPHLTNKGHRYFADKVVEALRQLPAV